MDRYGKLKFAFLGFILMCFIVGGFILMQNTVPQKYNKITENKTTSTKDIRIDTSKDYIYYSDNDRIVDELDIEYQNINFNFKGFEELEEKMNLETNEFKKLLEHDPSLEDDAYDKLSYAKYKVYSTYTYDHYLSLVVSYYEYTPSSLVKYLDSQSYVFDEETGLEVTNENLFTIFNTKKENIITKIKTYIEDQNLLKEDEELDSEATIENIGDNLMLYIDKMGRLSTSILVKSSKNDYNEIIILS